MIACRCNKHPGNPNGVCGQTYLYFGHEAGGNLMGEVVDVHHVMIAFLEDIED